MPSEDIAALAERVAGIGFTDPSGQRWLLVGSHTSTVKAGKVPDKADNCEGCGTKRKAHHAD